MHGVRDKWCHYLLLKVNDPTLVSNWLEMRKQLSLIHIYWFLRSASLPAGLFLTETNGEISGIPTSESPLTSYQIYAQNQAGVVTVSISIIVLSPVSFTYNQTHYLLNRNVYFSISPSLSGNSPSVTVVNGSLPLGLNMNSLGTISGTPIQSVTNQTLTLRAMNVVSDVYKRQTSNYV